MRLGYFALLFVGCGARVDADAADAGEVRDSSSVADTRAREWSTPPSVPDGSALPPVTSDAPAPIEPPPSGSIDCFVDDVSPSAPATFVEMFYQQQTGTCPSSDCVDFVTFRSSCSMSLQVGGVVHNATLSSGDCMLFKSWLTSDILLSKLRDTVTCYGKDGPGAIESTEITLTDGSARKKTSTCPVEPFVSHRACIAKVRAKYFPGK